MKIPYTKPSIGPMEIELVTDAVATGWGENCYQYLDLFERRFGEWLDVPYTIATSSCTGALHMGLLALGIGPGDEVILADTNWIATVAPVVHLGATPIFVDILDDSWCLDPIKVQEALTTRTKAIIATHLYGNLCNMFELLRLANDMGIPIIEDAAEAIGSLYFGRRAGSIGLFGVFSLHGSKTITTGEGGVFATRDPELYERVLTISNHGRAREETRQFWPEVVGLKYKMSNIQAALGCAQLERVEELVNDKRRIFFKYKELLSGLPQLSMNPEPEGTFIGAWMPTVVFPEFEGFNREQALETFQRNQIDARVFFWPLSELPMFKGTPTQRRSKSISSRGINLPSYFGMKDEEVQYVVDVVRSVAVGSTT